MHESSDYRWVSSHNTSRVASLLADTNGRLRRDHVTDSTAATLPATVAPGGIVDPSIARLVRRCPRRRGDHLAAAAHEHLRHDGRLLHLQDGPRTADSDQRRGGHQVVRVGRPGGPADGVRAALRLVRVTGRPDAAAARRLAVLHRQPRAVLAGRARRGAICRHRVLHLGRHLQQRGRSPSSGRMATTCSTSRRPSGCFRSSASA